MNPTKLEFAKRLLRTARNLTDIANTNFDDAAFGVDTLIAVEVLLREALRQLDSEKTKAR